MDQKNKDLMVELNEKLLVRAYEADDETMYAKLCDANAIIEKELEMDKINLEHQEKMAKIEADKEIGLMDVQTKLDCSKKDRWIQVGIFVGGLLIAPAVELVTKKKLSNHIAKLEEFDTFTSIPGRSIGSWFNWKNNKK